MSKLEDKIQETVKKQTIQDTELEGIFSKYLEIGATVHQDNPGYQAWSRAALPVCIALANIILSWKHPEDGRQFRASGELLYGLASNDFWVKTSGVLSPMLTAAHNSHKDWIGMTVERETLKEYAVYDKLMSGAEAMPLEIFSIVLYLVGGSALMATSSLPLKIALAPYFLR